MSILKGIMHHWNKTKNDYDIIHPETDYKKITDWNEGIVATLASTALGTLVSTLTSDSLLATMIQKVLTATGVKYNIAQNGYVCFGSLFGNIIIQWIYQSGSGTQAQITLPISLANYGTVVGIDGSVIDIHYAAYVHDRSIINVYTNTTGVWGFRAIIIGY